MSKRSFVCPLLLALLAGPSPVGCAASNPTDGEHPSEQTELAASSTNLGLITSSTFFSPPLAERADAKIDGYEDAALALLVQQLPKLAADARALRLEEHLAKFPLSRWTASLRYAVGEHQLRSGRFAASLASLRLAWDAAKGVRGLRSTADAASSRLLELYAWLGRTAELQAMLTEVRGYALDRAALAAQSAARMLTSTLDDPNAMLRCGQFALTQMPGGDDPGVRLHLEATKSYAHGTSLLDLAQYAEGAGIPMQMVRAPAGVTLYPAVAHFAAGHWAAITAAMALDGGTAYRVVDPSPLGIARMSEAAAKDELDGYFLVPASAKLPSGVVVVGKEEAAKITGTGGVAGPHEGAQQQSLVDTGNGCSRAPCTNTGMAGYGFNRYTGGLSIWDSPTGYVPENGESVQITAVYDDQRSLSTQQVPGFGPHWRASWVSWVEIAPMGGVARVFGREGGFQSYNVIDATPGARRYGAGLTDNTALVESSPGSFTRTLPDGSREVFGYVVSDGVSRPLLAMLSERIDAHGNRVRLGYDSRHRLVTLTDAMNRVTTIAYGAAAGGMHIKSVTDPFGRVASFRYVDPDNGVDPDELATRVSGSTDDWASRMLARTENARLVSITDVVGLVSRFTYRCGASAAVPSAASLVDAMPLVCSTDASGRTGPLPAEHNPASDSFIIQLDTPYGRTQFRTIDITDVSYRNIRHATAAIDPMGHVERVESYLGLRADERYVPETLPSTIDPQTPLLEGTGYLNMRNVYLWNKRAGEALGRAATADLVTDTLDRGRATVFHYLHDRVGGPSGATFAAPVLSSVKPPLEARTFFTYRGQTSAGYWRNSMDELATVSAAPTAIVRLLGPGRVQRTTLAYNAQNQPIRVVDPAGRTTLLTYEPNGLDLRTVAQVTGPGAQQQLAAFTYTTDGRRLVASATDDAGIVTRFTWDASGRIATITDGGGRVTRLTRTPIVAGTPSSTAPSTGETTTLTSPTGQVLTSETFAGFVSRIAGSGHSQTMSNDGLGRPTVIADEAGSKYTLVYDRLDLASIYDPLGARTTAAYDQLGRVTSVTSPLGDVHRYAWEPDAQLRSITDANGRVTTFTYDAAGHSTGKRLPDGATSSWVLDPASAMPVSFTDPRGTVSSLTWNVDGTLASHRVGSEQVAFSYDPVFARVTSTTDSTGTTTYTYVPTAPTRVQSTTSPQGSTTFVRDSLQRPIGWRIGSYYEQLGYDPATDRPLGTTSDALPMSFAHAGPNGRVSAIRFPSIGVATNYTWGGPLEHMQPTNIAHSTSTGSTGVGLGYDWVGRIATESRTGSTGTTTHRYGYDATGRLNAVTTTGGAPASIAHVYDRMGNRLRTTLGGATTGTFAYADAADKLTSITDAAGTHAITYDAAGNVTAIGADTYQWDANGRLTTIQYGGPSTGSSTTFAYDGDGRIHRVTERTASVVTSDKSYQWVGDRPVVESNATTGAVLRVFYANAVRSSDGVRALLRDARGSVIGITDTAGRLAQQATYDAFGNVASGGVTGASNPFGYAGYFVHDRSGLAITRHRFYSPRLGRWLSRDPIGEAGGPNQYTYVGNDPINLTDPSGLIEMSTVNALDSISNAVTGVADGFFLGLPVFKSIGNGLYGDGTIGGCGSSYGTGVTAGSILGIVVSAPRIGLRVMAAARPIAFARHTELMSQFGRQLSEGGTMARIANDVTRVAALEMKTIAEGGYRGGRALFLELATHGRANIDVPILTGGLGWYVRAQFASLVSRSSGLSSAVSSRGAAFVESLSRL